MSDNDFGFVFSFVEANAELSSLRSKVEEQAKEIERLTRYESETRRFAERLGIQFVGANTIDKIAERAEKAEAENAELRKELKGRTEQYNTALNWGTREHDIVARIWAIFGTPSYEELAGHPDA